MSTLANGTTDTARTVTRYPIPPNTSPLPSLGDVGDIAEGWDGDGITGNPRWWRKIAPGEWGPFRTGPKGDPGSAGPAGALAPWVPGATYTANVSTVLQRASVWVAADSHTAGTGSFEADALAGHWLPVGQSAVETFNPYLATSGQAIAGGASAPRTVWERCDGGGVITSLVVWVVATGGNVGVGVQRGTAGVDRAGSRPSSTRAFYSGSVACGPAGAAQTFAISGGVVVYPGDFLFLWSDTNVATFYSTGSTSAATFAALYGGTTYYSNAATPPIDASSAAVGPMRGPLILGRP